MDTAAVTIDSFSFGAFAAVDFLAFFEVHRFYGLRIIHMMIEDWVLSLWPWGDQGVVVGQPDGFHASQARRRIFSGDHPDSVRLTQVNQFLGARGMVKVREQSAPSSIIRCACAWTNLASTYMIWTYQAALWPSDGLRSPVQNCTGVTGSGPRIISAFLFVAAVLLLYESYHVHSHS